MWDSGRNAGLAAATAAMGTCVGLNTNSNRTVHQYSYFVFTSVQLIQLCHEVAAS